MLAALLGVFENRDCAVIPNSHFEEGADGELELVVPGGWDAFRFRHGANGDAMSLDSGQVREAEALRVLARNGWFDGTMEGIGLRIRLGERAKKLRQERVRATA